MAHYENESLLASKILDDLGYGESMISLRRSMAMNIESVMNDIFYNENQMCYIIAGSKAEGLTAPLENDSDFMEVDLDVICKEDIRPLRHDEKVHTFHLEMNHSCPGYTLLRNINICASLQSKDLYYDTMMRSGPGKYYLSSDLIKNHLKQLLIEERHLLGNHSYENVDYETHGPSIRINFLSASKDNVLALTCECPSYITEWKWRPRSYQWPPENVIREVSSLESHVVPVGPTTSSFRFLEWRICFTKGEIRLVHSLNDCLTKVLYMLKEVAKVTLKPISKDMSSYIIKNTVFWLAELNDYELFSPHNLILILKKGLTNLKQFIVANNLPNYMIPQRNLFDGKFTSQQRTKMCMRLDSLLKEGPSIVMKCAKFRYALSCSQMEIRRLSENLHRTQIMIYLLAFYISANRVPSRSEPFTQVIDIIRVIMSDDVTRFMYKQFLISQGLDPDEVEKELIELNDSISNDPEEYFQDFREINLHEIVPNLF